MKSTTGKRLLGLGLGLPAGWVIAQQAWTLWQLAQIDVEHSLAAEAGGLSGTLFARTRQTPAYHLEHSVEGGIERLVFHPARPRFETPLLMAHGMWHGAWLWRPWQELFAKWGWESHAFSLPGHAGSPMQRPISRCTLDYYLRFLKAEVERLPRTPVLFGHSMGGAIIQWYFKHINDRAPAAVMVAPWVSHCNFADGLTRLLRLDPVGCLMMMWTWDATSLIRSPQRARRALLHGPGVISDEELYARLGPESAMVLYQHNPPFWRPPERVKTPMLWIAAGEDALIGESAQRQSATYYHADYLVVEGAGHDLMLEASYHQTADRIHHWLLNQGVR